MDVDPVVIVTVAIIALMIAICMIGVVVLLAAATFVIDMARVLVDRYQDKVRIGR